MKKRLYVLSCEGYLKIGVAKNVTSRVRTLQVGNPFKIEPIRSWTVDDAERLESIILRHLDRYRIGGEWFRGEALSEIERLVEEIRDE